MGAFSGGVSLAACGMQRKGHVGEEAVAVRCPVPAGHEQTTVRQLLVLRGPVQEAEKPNPGLDLSGCGRGRIPAMALEVA